LLFVTENFRILL